jgi:DNA-binding NtrC family response regulator
MSTAPEIAPNDLWTPVPWHLRADAVPTAATKPADLTGNSSVRRFETRTAIVVSADTRLRQALAESLKGLRWRVHEASGGAQAMLLLENSSFEAMILDNWLPDLQVNELAELVRQSHPEMDLLLLDGGAEGQDALARPASPRRNELLHAMREARRQVGDSPGPPQIIVPPEPGDVLLGRKSGGILRTPEAFRVLENGSVTDGSRRSAPASASAIDAESTQPLPDVVGSSRAMREIAWLVRMVAPRTTTVLIEGETGTGKEVIAKTLHKLSPRANKPFAVLNCAAIPESLLEAELFGHARGAFTGAVQSRMGRIEAAHGGTLLLDEIGEMPMSMQAKMLRFLESGELQRVGDNDVTRVDVRLIAATHQPLEQNAADGTFRLDLYHRLAVFPIEVPPLRERLEDIPALAEHFLEQLADADPRKRLREDALARLEQHEWPGNVRELMHVLERALILSGHSLEIGAADIRYRRRSRQ